MRSSARKLAILLAALSVTFGAGWAQAATSNLIPITNSWRYNQSGANLSGQFQAVGYDDTVAGWSAGQGLIGLEAMNPFPYPYPIRTPLTVGGGRITYYFRTHFNMPTNPAGWFLVATNYVDDGAVIYINGLEAARIRIASGTVVTAATPASLAGPEGQPALLIIPATNVVQGDNVLAVEVHQNAANSSDIVFGLGLGATTSPPPAPLPDLIIDGTQVNPRFETKTWPANDCEVNEGCGTPGTRRLLRFDTWTRNIGTADLVLGDPAGNPLFVYDSCHGHYHFTDFAAYRLLDLSNNIVAVGKKVGFCLEDITRIDPSAPPSTFYTCSHQGIQRGWADIYNSGLPCQFVDITDTPPGHYWLELEIDPENKIPELNETNNTTRVTVEITPPCAAPPPNNNFAAAQVIAYRVATLLGNTDCATKEAGEPTHAGIAGGFSIWYRWTAPASGSVTITTDGSNFDTLLAVYTGNSLNTLTSIASDDDAGVGANSLVTFNAAAGAVYRIAVDGFGGAVGSVFLNVNPGGNDAFAACVPLSGQAGSIGGTTINSTRETGEPAHANVPGSNSIWFCWTAPVSGPMMFDTFGSRFDTLLAIYNGSSVGALSSVASNDDARADGASRVTFTAVSGTTYHIAIDDKNGATGVAALNWRPVLRLTSVVRSGPLFQFTIAGAPGDRCVIETSSDFSSWHTWTRVTNSVGTMTVTDPISAGIGRFYRVHTE